MLLQLQPFSWSEGGREVCPLYFGARGSSPSAALLGHLRWTLSWEANRPPASPCLGAQIRFPFVIGKANCRSQLNTSEALIPLARSTQGIIETRTERQRSHTTNHLADLLLRKPLRGKWRQASHRSQEQGLICTCRALYLRRKPSTAALRAAVVPLALPWMCLPCHAPYTHWYTDAFWGLFRSFQSRPRMPLFSKPRRFRLGTAGAPGACSRALKRFCVQDPDYGWLR